MSNHRVSRFLTGYLLLTLSVIVMACSREDRSAYDLIRLAAPERIESAASEHGARMTAMDSASKNASEMIGKLTLQYNRARQAAITKELLEIISGAESIKA